VIRYDLDNMKFYPSREASKLLVVCWMLLRKRILQEKIDNRSLLAFSYSNSK